MTRHDRAIVVLVSALAFAGCAEKGEAASVSLGDRAAAPEQVEAKPRAEEGAMGEAAGAPGNEVVQERKLIQNAELHMQVDAYGPARSEIDQQLAALGGFVADARVEHRDGQVSSADLTIRVPSEKLGEFLAGAAGHGDVTHETLKSEDITDGYYDTQARLANAKRMEARLLELIQTKADNMTSLLELEREIARVRETIERYEGKLKMWDGQVALATVKLRLVTRQVYAVTAPKPPKTLGEKVSTTFAGSVKTLEAFGQGTLLVLVAVAPWLLPLTLLVLALRWMNRRWVNKRVAQRPVVSMPAVSMPAAEDAVA
jgi:hypothetical protein